MGILPGQQVSFFDIFLLGQIEANLHVHCKTHHKFCLNEGDFQPSTVVWKIFVFKIFVCKMFVLKNFVLYVNLTRVHLRNTYIENLSCV